MANMNSNSFLVLKFEETKIPVFKEVRGKDWIFYGDNNLYPNDLITLFNRSAKHNAIVTSKSEYIAGQGLKAKAQNVGDKVAFDIFNSTFTDGKVDTLFFKCGLDLELFNGFALQMIPTKKGGWVAYHIDFARLRCNKDKTTIFYSEDWSKYKQDEETTGYKEYPAFDVEKKTESILYYRSYRPKAGLDVYTYPDYIGCIPYIECDYQIANFHVNNLRNGFTGATVINFFNGEPTPEEQKKIEAKFKSKFAGTDAAGGVVLVFSDSKSKEPKIENILPSDFDKQFDILNKTVQQEIFTGHKITSPMLFGIKTEGQLGGRNELIEAFELFQNVYINSRQTKLLSVFDEFAKMYGVTGGLGIIPIEPIGYFLTESEVSASLTPDEKRNWIAEKLDIPIQLDQSKTETKTVADNINTLSPLVANNVLNSMTVNEVRSLAGLPPIAGGDVLNSAPIANTPAPTQMTTHVGCAHDFAEADEDSILQVFSEYGVPADNYSFIRTKFVHKRRPIKFEDVVTVEISKEGGKVLSAIKGNPKGGINEIADAVKLPSETVLEIVNKLQEDGLLDTDGTNYKITSAGNKMLKQNNVLKIKSMYQYALSPYLKGQPAVLPDNRTRPFCEKLIGLNKLYTRNELSQISQRVYGDENSVWIRRGGFYRNPTSGETTPFCRHVWALVTVIEK